MAGLKTLTVLISVTIAQIALYDGESTMGEVKSASGGEVLFSYHLQRKTVGRDLIFSTTLFSDWSAPDLYMSADHVPTQQVFEFSARSWGTLELDIGANQVKNNATYYVLAVCETFCRFTVTPHYEKPTKLEDGLPLQNFLLKGGSKTYYFSTSGNPRAVTIEAIPLGFTDSFEMVVTMGNMNGQLQTVTKSWYRGQRCFLPRPLATTYWIGITADEALEFVLKAYEEKTAVEMIADFPTTDEVEGGHWKYYQFYADDSEEDIFIMRTVYTGEMDLYIRVGALPTHSLYTVTSPHNDTILLPSQVRSGPGTIYLGVYARSLSSFILTISLNSLDFMPLLPGLSQVGSVSPEELFYFYMDIPVQASLTYTLNLQVYSGFPDIYIKLCTSASDSQECRFTADELGHPEDYPAVEYALAVAGHEQIGFEHGADYCVGTLCRYIMCVKGRQPQTASFSLFAILTHRNQVYIRDGVPITMALPQSTSQLFTYSVLDPSVYRLSFQLTTISGQSSLCISLSPHSHDCLPTSTRIPTLEKRFEIVKGISEKWLNGTYYINITATIASDFTLLVHETLANRNSTISLFPGQPQKDVLTNTLGSDFRLYSFEIRYTNETKAPIDVYLTPYTGRMRLYVSNDYQVYDQNSRSMGYNWTTEAGVSASFANSMQIRTNDPAYLMSSVYMVLVLPIDWGSDDTASYSIMYTSGEGEITVGEGVPLKDKVEQGQYRYYLFPVAGVTLNSTITVAVMASSGDPDLYISADPATPHPNEHRHTWAGEHYGSEAISIDWTGDIHTRCSHTSHICGLYLSIYGYTAAVFSLLVTTRPDQLILIEKGPILRGELLNSQFSQYYSPIHTHKPLKLTLDPVLGHFHVSIHISPDPDSHTDLDSITSDVNITTKIVNISPNMYPSTCTSRCYVDFSVRCMSEKCRYELILTQDEEIQISEGKPVVAKCESDEIAYFSYYNPLESTNLVVSLTALSGGDPDLYVSRSPQPDISSAEWTSTNWHSDLVEITASGSDMRGEYYIGVGCDVVSSFALTITSGQIPLIRLANGRAFNGFLPSKSANFFYYLNELRENVTITLTPSSGNSRMYVKPHNDQLADIFGALPGVTDYVWTSNEAGRLVISPSDPHFCINCALLIAVITEETSCQYTILCHNEAQFTLLPNGIPVRIHLPVGGKRLIAYELVDRADLDISMSVYAGAPALYISLSPSVSESEYVWTTESSEHVEHVRINKAAREYRLGWYYGLIVSRGTEASVAITAHSRDSYVHLVDGWSQTYSLSYTPYDRLLFHYDVRNETTICRLNTWSTSMRPKVYATFGSADAFVETVPGPGTSQFEFDQYNALNVLEMTLPQLGIGRFTIGVYATPTAGYFPTDTGDFQLACTSGSSLTVISLSDRQFGFLDSYNQHKVYELRVPEEGQLDVWLIPCWGSFELEVARNRSETGTVDIKAKRVEDGSIQGNLHVTPGVYFVVVKGIKAEELAEGVSYELTTELLTAAVPTSTQFYPGNSGLIEWEEMSGTVVRLHWSPPEMVNGDRVKVPVRYQVYATVTTQSVMSTACGMVTGEERNATWLIEEHFDVTEVQVGIESSTPTTLNILAISSLESEFTLQSVPYAPIEVYLTGTHTIAYLYKFILAAAGLILALLLGALYLYIKSRRIEAVTMQLTEMAPISVQQRFERQIRSHRSSDFMSPRDTTGLMRIQTSEVPEETS